MSRNLIIGKTSQLSPFFPDDYERISSRDIDMSYLENNVWDSVYITFAEQRVHLNDVDYITPNYLYAKEIINKLSINTKKIVVYSTCELWNNKVGCVYLKDDLNYTYSNDYCLSKEMLINYIKSEREENRLNNIIIIHPFNFNSTYRKSGFLFSKIFDSLINKVPIEIGNTYFYRDIVHAKYIVERSIMSTDDDLVGSGRLFFINDYIRDLFKYFNMNYNEYVKENINTKSIHSEKLYYSYQKNIYTYDNLLSDTIEDIEKRINN